MSTIDAIGENVFQYLAGSIILASLAALVFGLTGYGILTALDKNKIHKNA